MAQRPSRRSTRHNPRNHRMRLAPPRRGTRPDRLSHPRVNRLFGPAPPRDRGGKTSPSTGESSHGSGTAAPAAAVPVETGQMPANGPSKAYAGGPTVGKPKPWKRADRPLAFSAPAPAETCGRATSMMRPGIAGRPSGNAGSLSPPPILRETSRPAERSNRQFHSSRDWPFGVATFPYRPPSRGRPAS